MPSANRPETVCIYHGNCADGFSGAWVVKEALGKEGVSYYPGIYYTNPPDVTDLDVILVDFSYKRPVLEEMIDRANSVIILDHHKTAEEDLRNLNGAKAVFDMNRSGCKIAWDYFFPGKLCPKLLDYVEDRDLFRFNLPGTQQIQMNTFSYEYTFDNWDMLMKSDPAILIEEGKVIDRKHQKDMKELVKASKRKLKISGHIVEAANLPYVFSDAGMILAQDNIFGVTYYDSPKGRVFSLRSLEGGIDVSEIAKKYGGGGHKHAAGFQLPHNQIHLFEVE